MRLQASSNSDFDATMTHITYGSQPHTDRKFTKVKIAQGLTCRWFGEIDRTVYSNSSYNYEVTQYPMVSLMQL